MKGAKEQNVLWKTCSCTCKGNDFPSYFDEGSSLLTTLVKLSQSPKSLSSRKQYFRQEGKTSELLQDAISPE
jgi:hypothetical protein